MATLPQDLTTRPRPGCTARLMGAIGWLLVLIMFVAVMAAVLPDLLVSYGLVAPETMANALHLTRPQPTALPPRQPLPVVAPVAPLPDCASVANTTTACQGVRAPAAEVQPAATPIYCEDVPPGVGITPCQWRDAELARQQQQQTAQAALQLWEDMADQAVEQDLRAPPTTPTAQVPTECQNPTSARARASCELIKRGIIHPKG